MRNPSIKSYFLFLNWVLPKVTGLNEYFQSEKPTITIIHSKMVQAYQEFLLMYMQREFVMRTPLHLINPADASRYIPTSNMYLGVDVSEYLQSPAVAGNPQMVQDILVRAQMFLVTLCTKIKEKYDFNDPILSRMRVLNPEAALSHRERDTTPSIATLCFLLPRCVSRDQVQAVDDEWRRLPLLAQDLPDVVKSIQ
ncbi:uncharacterized protein LOC127751483, partial [Frankliniella occidentalis]|uniref:Uncharacterized protein LOC127751483 n=1 Tax=Frankliniella occidentalis TaxID=133901 RepID=A0A9C6XU94_FRAOC